MTKFLIIFASISLVNVIFATIKSIVTVKGGKTSSALISGCYYAFYNFVLVMTVAEFDMLIKCLITFTANVIGVYIVKFVEEKMQKERMWKIEFTVPTNEAEALHDELKVKDIPNSYITISPRYTLFNCYCATKEESSVVQQVILAYNAKYFVSESKTLY